MALDPDNCIARALRKVSIRQTFVREFLAELLGTFVLIVFGDGVVAQVVLGDGLNDSVGSFFTINWGWGVGVTLAVLVAGGVSGAHINPAVTTAMVFVGKLHWSKMFHYIFAQYLGAFLGASVVYGTYIEALEECENSGSCGNRSVPGTAGIYATYPKDFLSIGGGFLDQIIGTMLLLLCVCAITDPKNMRVPSSIAPLYVGFTVLNIGICFGFNCGYAINPARDLGPRIFTSIAGWGSEVWTFGNNWWYVPVLGPHIGGLLGAVLYTLLIENHWDKNSVASPSSIELK